MKRKTWRQFGNSTGNGRQRSGGPVTDRNGSTAKQAKDASNGKQRWFGPGTSRNNG